MISPFLFLKALHRQSISVPPDSTKGFNTYHMIFHKNLRDIFKISLAHFLEPIADILLDEFLVLINDNIRRGGFLLGVCRD